MKKQFTITIEVKDGPNNGAYRALRAMLNAMLRSWGIKCVSYSEPKPTDGSEESKAGAHEKF